MLKKKKKKSSPKEGMSIKNQMVYEDKEKANVVLETSFVFFFFFSS